MMIRLRVFWIALACLFVTAGGVGWVERRAASNPSSMERNALLEGDPLWSRRAGSNAYLQRARATAVDSDDNVYLAGDFFGTINLGGSDLSAEGEYFPYASSAFIAKYAPDGTHLWSQRILVTLMEGATVTGVAVDSQGEVYVAGYFSGRLSWGWSYRDSAGWTDIFVAKFSSGGERLWLRTFGGYHDSQVYSLAVDSQGDVVLAGSIGGAISFDSVVVGETSVYSALVLKLTPNGTTRWAKAFKGPTNRNKKATQLALGPNGSIFISGFSQGGIVFDGITLNLIDWRPIVFLVRLQSSGAVEWGRIVGESFTGPGTLAMNATSGRLYASWETSFDSGLSGSMVARYTPQGELEWTREFEGSKCKLAVDMNGDLTIAATVTLWSDDPDSSPVQSLLLQKYDSHDNLRWSKSYVAESYVVLHGLTTDSLRNIITAGEFDGALVLGGQRLVSAGAEDIFVAKFQGAAPTLLARSGDADEQKAIAVVADGSNGSLIVGDFLGSVQFGAQVLESQGEDDIFLAKVDSANTFTWALAVSGPEAQHATAVARDGEGGILLAGTSVGAFSINGWNSNGGGNQDAFITRLDASGTPAWVRRFEASSPWDGSSASDVIMPSPFVRPSGIEVGAQGDVFVVGTYQGVVNLGSGVWDSGASSEAFVLKLNPAGTPVWAQRLGAIGSSEAPAVTVDPQGNIVVVAVVSSPDALSEQSFETLVVRRYDPSGQLLWSNPSRVNGQILTVKVRVNSSGQMGIAGSFLGSFAVGTQSLVNTDEDPDGFLLQFDSAGSPVGAYVLSDSGSLMINDFTLDADGHTTLAGSLLWSEAVIEHPGQIDIYLARLDPSGAVLWSRTLEGQSDAVAYGISTRSDGRTVLVGGFEGSLGSGAPKIESAGNSDAFVAQLAP